MRNKYYTLLVLLSLLIVQHGFAQNQQCTPACTLTKILPDSNTVLWSPNGQQYLVNKPDTAGVYQIYIGNKGSTTLTCISDKDTTGNYALPSCWWWVRKWRQRNKMQVRWDPSGKWVICVVERECYQELTYTPYSLLLTLLETGWKMDMWATNTTGDHWWPLDSNVTDPGNGVVGPVFTPDGKKAVWAQLQDTSKSTDKFGLWYMMFADFVDTGATGPTFINVKNINPKASRWIEPGNFSPDGKYLMISSDIGMADAEGQDQFILNVYNGKYINLNNSPKVWDEHGVFSPDGKKIIFMSSYPYRADTNTYHTLSLKTEFMLMDAVYPDSVVVPNPCDSVYYPGLEQLTHFNVAGYVESDTSGAVAAAGGWSFDGTAFYGQDLIAPSYKNWTILFKGNCGNDTSTVSGINENKINTSYFVVYPNPASQTIYLKFAQYPASETIINVMDITERVVMSTSADTKKLVPLDVSNLAQGIYLIKVIGAGYTNTARFIKQ